MKVIFAGSPAIAVPSLEVIFNIDGIELVGVLTNPDAPKGRHGTPVPTDVGEAALKANVPILKPLKLDGSAREQVEALKPDLLVSFAYGRLFGPKFLALFRQGGINIHPSLLPKYRGPTPIQAAILNRDTVTGITIQKLAAEMDSGDILSQEELPLTGTETAGSLSDIVSVKAADMLADVLGRMVHGFTYGSAYGGVQSREQNHGDATYCSLISKDDGVIDWNRSALEIEAKIRGYSPWTLCRTIHDGRELIILKADVYTGSAEASAEANLPGKVLGTDKHCGILIQTGDGILAVTELQYQAKKALLWRDFLNGARDFTGSRLV